MNKLREKEGQIQIEEGKEKDQTLERDERSRKFAVYMFCYVLVCEELDHTHKLRCRIAFIVGTQ